MNQKYRKNIYIVKNEMFTQSQACLHKILIHHKTKIKKFTVQWSDRHDLNT